MMKALSLFMAYALVSIAAAGELSVSSLSGLPILTLKQGDTVAKWTPDAGANVFSIEVDGIEYLHQPPATDRIAGVSCGVPVLYPTPNRVKDASFTFEHQAVEFEPNAGRNFIHGLVNRYRWEVIRSTFERDSVSVTCSADFRVGTELNRQFPFSHQVQLTVEVKEHAVRWTYEVDNRAGSLSIPFGFALHPYFVYQGSREQTFLTIPATHWMESESQLPSGKLIPASELDFPLGTPMSLAATKFDDVFWGMVPERPTRIEFRDVSRKITIATSPEFTHLVVWTPDRPFFGVESQTCSTDAHNLYAQGKQQAAHLQICPPGETRTGWVEYTFGQAHNGQE